MSMRWPTKKLRLAYREKQKPGWMSWPQRLLPLADGSLLLLSSKSGWNHLYRVDGRRRRKDAQLRPLVGQPDRIRRRKKGQVFFSADKEDSTRTDLYRVPSTGAPRSG